MALCSFQNVFLAFGETNLLQNVSFDLEEGAHVGLCGGNGAGKSTLLRLLSGALTPDAGRVEFSKPVSVGLLAQIPAPGDVAPDPGAADPEFLQTLSVMGGEAKLAAAPAATLSGGERMKLSLARLLAENPRLLLLDEPSNNLDYQGVHALIEAVNQYPGTLLVVSHDRYFLDQTVSAILELENGALAEYSGGYTDYRAEKERRFGERVRRWEAGVRQQTRLEESIRQARGWGEKAHRDSTKSDASGNAMGAKEFHRKKAEKLERRAKNQVRRLERLRENVGERPRGETQVWFAMESGEKKGRRILEADGLAMAFGEKRLFADTSFALLRGERAALFGPNGCGKTTFVKLLQGELMPSAGRLRVSPASAPFVLSQDILNLPAGETPLDYFRGLFGALTGEQRTLLACMGLLARHLGQRIGTLSLGERMKVKLAELIFSKRDFLVLDEPTNSLDLHARETLEDALATYPGTLLVVSHDLYFLERVCDKTLVFEDGRIVRREQTFAEYITIREES